MADKNIIPEDAVLKCSHEQLVVAIRNDDSDLFSTELGAYSEYSFSIHFEKTDENVPWMFRNDPPLVCVVCFFAAKECFTFLINCSANLEQSDGFGRSTAIFAAAGGSLDIIKQLKANGVKFHWLDRKGDNAVHYAAKFARTDVVKYLFSIGTSLIERNERGATPFMWACSNGSIDIVKFIAQHGAKCNEMTFGRWSPLHYAATNDGNFEAAKFLVEQSDIKMDLMNVTSQTPINIAASKGSTQILKLLLEKGAEICAGIAKIGFCEKKHAIFDALENEQMECIKTFLENERSVGLINPKLMDQILDKCNEADSTEELKIICDFINEHAELSPSKGIEFHIRKSLQSNSSVEFAETMLGVEGIDINFINEADGYSLLHSAVQSKNVDKVKLMIEKGADPNVTNNDGFTPIMFAAQKNAPDVVMYLLEIPNLDINLTKKKGVTLTSIVSKKQKTMGKVLNALQQHG